MQVDGTTALQGPLGGQMATRAGMEAPLAVPRPVALSSSLLPAWPANLKGKPVLRRRRDSGSNHLCCSNMHCKLEIISIITAQRHVRNRHGLRRAWPARESTASAAPASECACCSSENSHVNLVEAMLYFTSEQRPMTDRVRIVHTCTVPHPSPARFDLPGTSCCSWGR
jgi:hypothetical protein